MTPAQYAKHRGVSRQYIHKLIKAGKLTMLDGEIDLALADAELEMARAQSSHGPRGTAAQSKVMNDYRRAVTRCANARAEALEMANRTKASNLVSEEKVEEREMRALRTLYDRLELLAPTLTARYDGPRDRALYQWEIAEDVNEALHDCSFLIQAWTRRPMSVESRYWARA